MGLAQVGGEDGHKTKRLERRERQDATGTDDGFEISRVAVVLEATLSVPRGNVFRGDS